MAPFSFVLKPGFSPADRKGRIESTCYEGKEFMDRDPGSSLCGLSEMPEQVLQEAMGENRRRHPRYPCEGRAEVFVPHGALLFEGRILNLSLSGCFVETPRLNLERGTRVEVFFATRQVQIRIAGHIAILHRGRGAGIAFDGLSPRLTRQIADLVSELAEQGVRPEVRESLHA